MPVSYDIEADVVDIRSDSPFQNDEFFVDTNVWFWFAYSCASIVSPTRQIQTYPLYIKKILTKKAKIHRCELILSELAHIIESTEYDLFCERRGEDVNKKEFRHNHSLERESVVDEIENAWEMICNSSESFDLLVNEKKGDVIIKELRKYPLDCYDIIYLSEINKTMNKSQVITDDGDFVTVPDITVFTSNTTVIKAASDAGKLIKR